MFLANSAQFAARGYLPAMSVRGRAVRLLLTPNRNLPLGYTRGMRYSREQYVWEVLRLILGFLFLWAFLDKLLGLGFATPAAKAWLHGISPTYGFLKFAAQGALVNFYHSLAGSQVVDWLFMLGLLGVGVGLTLGVMVRLMSLVGALMTLLMFTALALPPVNNPLFDEHIIYAVVFVGLYFARPGQWLGLGGWWRRTAVVRGFPWLE